MNSRLMLAQFMCELRGTIAEQQIIVNLRLFCSLISPLVQSKSVSV